MSANEIAVDQPWEQRRDENARWYQRFAEYLRLDAGRSVRAVYNREKGNARSKSVPASWSQAAHRYEWQRRAEVYDAWRRAAVFKVGNAQDTERVKKLDALINAMHERLIAGLNEVEVNEKFIERYLATIDLMARHTGGYAPQRHEVSGKDGKAIQVESDAPAMRVVFYVPEINALPEIGDLSNDGKADAVDGTVSEESNDEHG